MSKRAGCVGTTLNHYINLGSRVRSEPAMMVLSAANGLIRRLLIFDILALPQLAASHPASAPIAAEDAISSTARGWNYAYSSTNELTESVHSGLPPSTARRSTGSSGAAFRPNPANRCVRDRRRVSSRSCVGRCLPGIRRMASAAAAKK